jgi:hypothetical protein
MGYGEFVGNESVHWTLAHEDERGSTVSLSSKQGMAHHPTVGHDVHVEKTARGCDPVKLDDVGRRKGHPGRYRVKLRFERLQDAQAALAGKDVASEDGLYVIALDVPVIRRKHASDPPPAEIRVDW